MPLVLCRAQGHRGDWNQDDFEVLDGDRHVGRIYRVTDHPDSPWFWGLLTRRKKYGTANTRDEAMAAFRAEYERWLREQTKA
jgi:hypothetical protein